MVPPELEPQCQASRVWISAAIDGEATDAERAGLRAHVADCAACREWAALAESLVLRVRTAEPAVPSRQLVLPPAPAVPVVRRRRRAGSRVFAAVSVAAAVIAAGFFTGTLGQGTPEQQRTPPERVMYVAIADTPVIGQPIGQQTTGRPRDR
jgi:predicted anti-sigma-YlaC factor YlaD